MLSDGIYYFFTFIPVSSSLSGKHTSYKVHYGRSDRVSKVHQEIEESLYAYLQSIGVSKISFALWHSKFGGKLGCCPSMIQ